MALGERAAGVAEFLRVRTKEHLGGVVSCDLVLRSGFELPRSGRYADLSEFIIGGGQGRMHFHFVCPLEPKLVSRTRQYVSDAARALRVEDEVVGRLGLAVHELMENTVKYSTGPTAELFIEVDSVGRGGFRVTTTNRTDAASVRALRESLSVIGSSGEPMQIYEMVIRRSLSLGPEHSGLGLARIYAEAGLELAYRVDGERVTISATQHPGALTEKI